jgi:hypothetical protein
MVSPYFRQGGLLPQMGYQLEDFGYGKQHAFRREKIYLL